jgi:hypothetical protein
MERDRENSEIKTRRDKSENLYISHKIINNAGYVDEDMNAFVQNLDKEISQILQDIEDIDSAFLNEEEEPKAKAEKLEAERVEQERIAKLEAENIEKEKIQKEFQKKLETREWTLQKNFEIEKRELQKTLEIEFEKNFIAQKEELEKEFQKELEILNSEKAGFQKELEILNSEKAGFQKELEILNSEKAGFQKELEILNSEKARFQKELEILNSEKIGFQKELEILNATLQKYDEVERERKDAEEKRLEIEKLAKLEAERVEKELLREYLVWSGREFKDFGDLSSEETFLSAIQKSLVQGEFEKTVDFQKRIKANQNDILNSWLGEQKILSMSYDADREEFLVLMNYNISFSFPIPISVAKEFRENVENLNILFSEKEGNISIVGAEQVYKNISYKSEFLIDFTKERREAKAFLKYPRKYSRNSNGVVSDGYGLEWDDSKDTKLDFSGAEAYCENLVLDSKSDWRLPNRKELWYLAERNGSSPQNSSVFWSGDEVSSENGKVWVVDFSNGLDYWRLKSDVFYTRCVRGESFYKIDFYKIDFYRKGDTVFDKRNGLAWADIESEDMEWEEAISYCENMVWDSKSDWRLPTIEELYSITDQKGNKFFVNENFYKIGTSKFWSATPRSKKESWIAVFEFGSSTWSRKSNDYFVRCVRDLE